MPETEPSQQIPRIFHRVVPVDVPEQFERNWARLQELHPGWEFRTWQDPLDPDDFELGHQFDACGSGAQLAGLVRLEVLHREGGIYLDMDVEPVRSFEPLRRFPAFIGTEDGRVLTDAVIGSCAGHPGLQACLERLAGTDMRAGALATGPLLTTAVLSGRSDVKVLGPEAFYPAKFTKLRAAKGQVATGGTFAIHQWHRSWNGARDATDVTSARAIAERTRVAANLAVRHHGKRLASFAKEAYQRAGVPHRPHRGTYIGGGRVLVDTVYRFPLLVSGGDTSVSPSLVLDGDYHPAFLRYAQERVGGTSVFLDVGANIGYYSVAVARWVGPHGRVIAVEPAPGTCALLQANVVMNELEDRFEIIEAAATDGEVTELLMEVDPLRLGGAKAGIDLPEATSGTDRIPVAAVRLDELVDDLDFIDLVKIDVEGGEPGAIRGLEKALGAGKVGSLVVEVLGHTQDDWDDLERTLRSLVDDFGAKVSLLSPLGRPQPVELERILVERHFLHVVFDFQHRNLLELLASEAP